MNYEADLAAKSAVELRKIGAGLGIPGAAKGKKADLIVAIAAKWETARIEREKAQAGVARATRQAEIAKPVVKVVLEPGAASGFQRVAVLGYRADGTSVLLGEIDGPVADGGYKSHFRSIDSLEWNVDGLGWKDAKTFDAAVKRAKRIFKGLPFESKIQAAPATPAKGRKICIVCNRRPGMTSAQRANQGVGADFADQCEPCYVEAGWENTHSDDDHQGVLDGTIAYGVTTHKTKAEFDAWLNGLKEETKDCWICRPEINKARADYTPKAGTSRAGMAMNTKNGQTGEEKAQLVAEALKDRFAVAVRKAKGRVICDAAENGSPFGFEMVWDLRGRFQYGASVVHVDGKTRKARNVAELLRLAAK